MPVPAAARTVVQIVTDDGQRHRVREERPPAATYPWGFWIMSEPAIRQLAKRVRSAPALRVFLLLPTRLSWEEWRRLDQRDLAAELETDAATINRALKELHGVGVIEKRGRGPLVEWRLSLDWGWRGGAGAYRAAMSKRSREKATTALTAAGPARVAEAILC